MSWHTIGVEYGFDKGGILRLLHTAGPVDADATALFCNSQLGLGAMQRGFGVIHASGFFTGKKQKWGLEAARCSTLSVEQRQQLVWKEVDFMPNQGDPAPLMDPAATPPLVGTMVPLLNGEAAFRRLLWVDFNGADGTSSGGGDVQYFLEPMVTAADRGVILNGPNVIRNVSNYSTYPILRNFCVTAVGTQPGNKASSLGIFRNWLAGIWQVP